MKHHDRERHPGPMRIMPNVGGESAAIIVAIGFVVMGLVGLPVAKFFLLGAVVLGVAVAILFHFVRK